MRTVAEFVEALARARKKPDPGYGGAVLPAGRILSGVTDDAELKAFKQALAELLASTDQNIRQWAITVGCGFVYFRDSIETPIPLRRDVQASIDGEAHHEGHDKKRDVGSFFEELKKLATLPDGVDRALRLDSKAAAGDEAIALLDAIEALLSSADESVRRFGVEVCVEFALRKPSHGPVAPEGPTEFVVHSGEPFRLNRNFTLRARKVVAIHLPRAILSPEGTPLSEIVRLSNRDATVGLLEAKPGEGVAAIIFELAPGDEISLTRSSEAIADDGTEGGVIVFDAQAA